MTMVTDHSTFDHRRLFSTVGAPEKEATPYNFITFLAVAQALKVQFLPVTWQSGRQLLGIGSTSQVDQALMSKQASFAFKRVPDKDKADKAEKETLRCLISEITVLSHSTIQEYPNILDLQGICWDFAPGGGGNQCVQTTPVSPSSGDKCWPVLVFEKSHYGDLYHFARSSVGRELDVIQRWKICWNIGLALAHMHCNHIVHGDIKPQNVLIFKDEQHLFATKVADFGFSTQYAHSDDRIALPRSWPWYAPECVEYPDFTPAQARRTDVFSFGILSLWFIFEKQLSGILPFPEASILEGGSNGSEGKHRSLEILAELKGKRSLLQLANKLAMDEIGLEPSIKRVLQLFFSGCLAHDPESRVPDMQRWPEHMNFPTPALTDPAAAAQMQAPVDQGFNLCRSLYAFYHSDYRLRSYILRCLEEIVSKNPTSPLCTQLAFCYVLGFGCPKSEMQPRPQISNRAETEIQLREVLASELASEGQAGNLYNVLRSMGRHSPTCLADVYAETKVLETAARVTRDDLESVELVLGAEHRIASHIKSILSSIAIRQGRLADAERLQRETMDTIKRTLGPDNIANVACMANLAMICRGQGRWQEAEELQAAVVDIRKKILGQEHYDTLTSMCDLALTYNVQGRLREAEMLGIEVIEIRKRTLGYDHPATLSTMANLATTYLNQGRWQQAEKLGIEAMRISKATFGHEHPSTLAIAGNLAATYTEQGRLHKAEKLEVSVVEASKRELGEEHPDTLTRMNNLATTYEKQGRLQEAEELLLQVLQINRRARGKGHLSILNSMANLACICQRQGRWQNAEKLQTEALDMSKRALGPEHLDTLTHMEHLAETYCNQGQLQNAERLLMEVESIKKRVLSEDHPSTLTSMNNLAALYFRLEKLQEAEKLEARVLNISQRTLGPEHPDTLTTMSNLAFMWNKLGRHADAKHLLASCIELYAKVFGAEHFETRKNIEVLESWG